MFICKGIDYSVNGIENLIVIFVCISCFILKCNLKVYHNYNWRLVLLK